jgi:plastocyanin
VHYPIRSCVSLLLATLPLCAVAGPPTINSCTPATATDLTGQTAVTIQYVVGGQFIYSPNCIKVLPGTTITVTSSAGGSFGGHPFRPGFVVGAVKTPDPMSPIPAASVGNTTSFMLSREGLFGYYCDFHAVSTGMNGAILVGSETIFAHGYE